MTPAPTLFDAVRPTDPHTSHQAAARNRTTLASRTKSILAQHPEGLTDWELADLFPDDAVKAARMKPSVAKRRKDAGAVEVEGLTRLSPFDGPCLVWRLPVAEVTGARP